MSITKCNNWMWQSNNDIIMQAVQVDFFIEVLSNLAVLSIFLLFHEFLKIKSYLKFSKLNWDHLDLIEYGWHMVPHGYAWLGMVFMVFLVSHGFMVGFVWYHIVGITILILKLLQFWTKTQTFPSKIPNRLPANN